MDTCLHSPCKAATWFSTFSEVLCGPSCVEETGQCCLPGSKKIGTRPVNARRIDFFVITILVRIAFQYFEWKSPMETTFSLLKILTSIFFWHWLTCHGTNFRGNVSTAVPRWLAKTMPAAWLFKSQVNVCDGTILDLVPLFFCTLVEQFWTSTGTLSDWESVRAEQSNNGDGDAKVGI